VRYRPFGATGKAVSALSLLLREAPNMGTPQAWRALIYSAMENGINCFELAAGIDVLALGMGEALRAVERRLVFVGWRLRADSHGALTAEAIANSVRSGLQKTGAGHFDALMIDEAAYQTLTPQAHTYLGDLRASRVVMQLGVVGDGPAIDACIEGGQFDVLATPFNLTSDWKARRRVRDASARDMTIVAYDPFPTALIRGGPSPTARGGGLLGRPADPLAGVGTYAFLHETPSWNAEELCLAYLFTEPAFASIQVQAFRADNVSRLAAVTDRDLPTGVAAQIEMARFSADAERRRA
jgi:aryl-alcohol dehydrogenase-like predicted oxidoreductase